MGDIFYRKLYGKEPDDNKNYLNTLKLAEEIDAVFGRPVLEKLLIDSIPDKLHKPTELFTKTIATPMV